jgi:hypothetical protein
MLPTEVAITRKLPQISSNTGEPVDIVSTVSRKIKEFRASAARCTIIRVENSRREGEEGSRLVEFLPSDSVNEMLFLTTPQAHLQAQHKSVTRVL